MKASRHGRWIALAAWLVTTAACGGNRSNIARDSTSAHQASALRGPFDIEARRAKVGKRIGAPPAAPRVDPVRDVMGVSFYVDEAHSVADPMKKKQNVDALRPLRTFVGDVEALADGFVSSSPADTAYAERALALLDEWASAEALLGRVNHQGAYERLWTLGSLAIAYLKLEGATGLDEASRHRVQAWFVAVAHACMPDYMRPDRTDNRNNHAYWAGLDVLAAGVAANDRTLFVWGIERVRIGIAEITADGSLPLEMAREKLALHYHVFALAPLVMAAEIAEANGIDLYAERGRALDRLVTRVVSGFDDPRNFAAAANTEQTFTLPPKGTDLAWAEAYDARFPEPKLEHWIAEARPLADPRLGGDMTIAFGTPRP